MRIQIIKLLFYVREYIIMLCDNLDNSGFIKDKLFHEGLAVSDCIFKENGIDLSVEIQNYLEKLILIFQYIKSNDIQKFNQADKEVKDTIAAFFGGKFPSMERCRVAAGWFENTDITYITDELKKIMLFRAMKNYNAEQITLDRLLIAILS